MPKEQPPGKARVEDGPGSAESSPPQPEPAQRETQPADDVLIEALATGSTYREAGATVGVGARTVSRRLEDPDFAVRVTKRRAEMAEETKARIRQVASARVNGVLRAQEVLVELLDNEDPRVQLAAARELHSNHLVVTALEVEERLMKAEGQRGLSESPAGNRGFRL